MSNEETKGHPQYINGLHHTDYDLEYMLGAPKAERDAWWQRILERLLVWRTEWK